MIIKCENDVSAKVMHSFLSQSVQEGGILHVSEIIFNIGHDWWCYSHSLVIDHGHTPACNQQQARSNCNRANVADHTSKIRCWLIFHHHEGTTEVTYSNAINETVSWFAHVEPTYQECKTPSACRYKRSSSCSQTRCYWLKSRAAHMQHSMTMLDKIQATWHEVAELQARE